MDYIPSMFRFDQSTDHQELFQMISGFPCKLDPLDYQIQLGDHRDQVHPPTPSQDGRDPTHKRCRPSSSSAFGEKDHHGDQENPSEKKKKKVVHRENERQRRKEMAVLYASLRSLIPLEHLKGKRSTSDQMHVATNYIKELQRKNQELSAKRDELKRLLNSCSPGFNTSIDHDQNSKRHNSESIISVRHSRAGIEVVANTAFRQGLPLARLLQLLAGEGLNVVRCVSARVNERFLHTIESEAMCGKRSLNLTELEKKLKNLTV